MSILGALGKLLSALIRNIFKFIKKYLKIILAIAAVFAVIYFAPAISTWLSSVGAPEWLSGAFQWVGENITPSLNSVIDGVKTLAKGGWDAFTKASIGTKLAVVTGLAAAIAPEETAGLVKEVADTTAGVVGAVATGLLSSPIGVAAMVFVGWFLLRGRGSSTSGVTPVIVSKSKRKEVGNGDED